MPGMGLVFGVRGPLKVVDVVIGRIAIDVIDLWLPLRVGYEGLSHQAVDLYHPLLPWRRLEVIDQILPVPSRLAS